VSGNTGFQGSTGSYYQNQPMPGNAFNDPWPGAGWLRLLGDDVFPWADTSNSGDKSNDHAIGGVAVSALPPPAPAKAAANRTAMRGCMDYHTWVADHVRVRNLILPSIIDMLLSPKPADPATGRSVPTMVKTKTTIDGDAVYEWSQPASAGGGGSSSLLLGEVDLAANPSIANRSVFLALDTRLLVNATLGVHDDKTSMSIHGHIAHTYLELSKLYPVEFATDALLVNRHPRLQL
jgi:hypothetical protein